MQRLWSVLFLALLTPAALAADAVHGQLPVTLGAGLNHPLPITAVRGELAVYSGDADLTGVALQGERPLQQWQVGAAPLTLGVQGSALLADVDRGRSSANFFDGRLGGKLSLPIAAVPGLWAGASLNLGYARFGSNSDSDVFAVLSARYQARPADFYSSLSIGAEGLQDTGLLLGAALPLPSGQVLGAELATEPDQLTGYYGLPLAPRWRLNLALGVADDVDLIAQAQIRLVLP